MVLKILEQNITLDTLHFEISDFLPLEKNCFSFAQDNLTTKITPNDNNPI
jgi:hypothetical protein